MEDKLELSDGSIWIMQDIKKVLQELYDHYRSVVNRNKYLQEENDRLKSESYKDEELSKMKEKYDKMNEDYLRGFPISEAELKRINEWQDKIVEKYPAGKATISGRYTYIFFPTSIGVAGKIKDNISGEEFEFQELG